MYTQDWHPPRTPHFVTDGGPWPVHCVRDTWGAAFHPDLVVAGRSVRKGTGGEDGYSGFTMRDPTSGDDASTGLDELLRPLGVERVVVVGLALDYCVKATALDAVALGYSCVVPRRATAPVEVHPGDGAAAEAELAAAGVDVGLTLSRWPARGRAGSGSAASPARRPSTRSARRPRRRCAGRRAAATSSSSR